MTALVIAEHDNASIKGATLNTVTAALACGGDVHVLVAGHNAAEAAKALKIPVYSILVGKGGKVPFPAGQDIFGQTAWRDVEIPINPELLENMAQQTGGEFYRATDRESLKQGLQKVLDSLERSKLMEGGAMATYREEFHQYLLLAALLLCVEFFLKSTFLRVFP